MCRKGGEREHGDRGGGRGRGQTKDKRKKDNGVVHSDGSISGVKWVSCRGRMDEESVGRTSKIATRVK